ncbi:MAG: regulatory protein RecX [Porticoccus sp.]|nr:regulatory protein RecX [Porticoccus sp.]MBQ0808453.1 regulatory protein RecX [Porticoccus sp.]
MTSTETDTRDPLSIIRLRAMGLLARREHSHLELHRKLADRFPEHGDLLDQVLAGLQQDNLQSDERFAEAFVSYRVRRGQGPHRISMELQQRGLDKPLAERAVAESGADWTVLAGEVMAKKYGDKPCNDFSERAKRCKFLQYRGFNTDHISACFNED